MNIFVRLLIPMDKLRFSESLVLVKISGTMCPCGPISVHSLIFRMINKLSLAILKFWKARSLASGMPFLHAIASIVFGSIKSDKGSVWMVG
jgi:hypothetical protein